MNTVKNDLIVVFIGIVLGTCLTMLFFDIKGFIELDRLCNKNGYEVLDKKYCIGKDKGTTIIVFAEDLE